MMTTFYQLLAFVFIQAAKSLPQDVIQTYALNPAQINNLYHNPDSVNHYRDVAPQPLIKPEGGIEDTVKEVEELIRANPKLPRLTRGEIIDIIENITKIDTKNKTRQDGQRALMVVMPFTAGSAQGDDIKELYTRTPVTRIIGSEERPKMEKKPRKPPRKWSLFPQINLENEVLPNKEEQIPNFQFLPDFHSTTTTEKIMKRIKVTTTRKPANKPQVTTYKPIFTVTWSPPSQPVHIVEQTTSPSPVFTTQVSTSTAKIKMKATRKLKPPIKHSNHKYEDYPSEGIHIMNPPVFTTMNDDGYSEPYIMKLPKPQLQPEITIEEVKITPDMYADLKPKMQLKQVPVKTPSTEKSILDDIAIPAQYKEVVKDLDLIITPDKEKLLPTQQVIKHVNIIPPKIKTFSQQTTTAMPDISNIADNLSPDMKDLLINFGLINKPGVKRPDITTESIPYIQNAPITADSYISFKPLPNNAPSRDDMDEFLTRFGLGRNSFRSQKSISMDKPKKELNKNSELNLEAIPDTLKGVIHDLGFTTKTINDFKDQKELKSDIKQIFKPSNNQNTTEEELKKLGKLLDMIKDLEKMNGNMTAENLENFDTGTLKELIGNFNGKAFVPLNEQDAPNPVNFDDEVTKNGVKRQENMTTEATVAITIPVPTSTSAEIATSTGDSRSVFLEDLEASFGGVVETPITTEEPTTTTTIRTGFYYLLDWNTFWEMDNQIGRRVSLRFQPHAGDPRYFQSVTVP